MYEHPYAGISTEVSSVLKELIPDDDEYHKVHARRFARTLEVLLDQKPHGKLLEVGTSSVLPLALKELAPEVEVHVTEYRYEPTSGSTLLTVGDKSRRCKTYRVNLEEHNLQAKDETFNFIICSEVVEHMERDPMFMLSELNRVCKTGGTLILTTPNITSSHNISKMLRGLDPYFYMQYRKSGGIDRHNYEYSLFSISKLIKAAGFSGSGWTEDTFEHGITQDILKLRQMGYPLPHVGDNIFCVGKKSGPVNDRYPDGIYQD